LWSYQECAAELVAQLPDLVIASGVQAAEAASDSVATPESAGLLPIHSASVMSRPTGGCCKNA
jgi:hypothetical protein